MAISSKGAKTDQIYIHAKTAKTPISRKAKKIRTALASDFSIALEQVVLTPALTNMAISRKGAKTEQIYIDAKIAKTPISRKAKKIRMVLASDFSVALEQVVLTPVLKNPAISRKGAKTEQIYIDAKIAKSPISQKTKKISTVLSSDFSILERVVHNQVGMT
jgi:hypothetical protein